MNPVLSYDDYREVRFFGALDGIRAISVVLVVAWHMPEKEVFGALNGWSGVTMFFVLSGFLITTLCLREAKRGDGRRFDLRGFYIRRAFRILPLYFFTVALAATLAAAFDLMGTWSEFRANLGYYATLSVDLIHTRDQPLRHTWSLGVEEKFYVLWPLLLLLFLRISPSRRLALTSAFALCLMVVPGDYLPMYFPITVGCALAFALDQASSYRYVERAADWNGGLLLGAAIAAAAVLQLTIDVVPAGARIYTLAVAAMIALLIVRGRGAVSTKLASNTMRWLGDRSYGIYLLHPLVIHATDRLIAPDDTEPLTMASRFIVALAGSLLAAHAAHLAIETPLRDYGRNLAKRQARRASSADSSVDPVKS